MQLKLVNTRKNADLCVYFGNYFFNFFKLALDVLGDIFGLAKALPSASELTVPRKNYARLRLGSFNCAMLSIFRTDIIVL